MGCCHWNVEVSDSDNNCWSSVGQNPCFVEAGYNYSYMPFQKSILAEMGDQLGMRCVIVDDQGIVPFNASFEECKWTRTDLDAEEECKNAYGYFDDCMMYNQDYFTCLVNILK